MPALVITEVIFLIGTRLGSDAEVRFIGDLAAGDFVVEAPAEHDWIRIAELVHAYRDLPLGSVDASVVALCERRGINRVATLDQRHFSVVRPKHADGFELLP